MQSLRRARRARVLAEMEPTDIDVLVVGREANARYVSGAPRLWTAGSRAFGPGCVLVRGTGAVHLLSTWDEGIPDDIPHENLYGISFNAMNFLRGAAEDRGRGDGPDRGHRCPDAIRPRGFCPRRSPRPSSSTASHCLRPGPPGQAARGGRRHPGLGPPRRAGARRGDGGARARYDRATAHGRVHGGDGVGGRDHPGDPGRRLDHVARSTRGAGRAGTYRSSEATWWRSRPG